MKFKAIPLLLMAIMSLSSCGSSYSYKDHLEDYVFKLDFHSEYNILQLTDIHWSANTSTSSSMAYLNKLFSEVDSHIKANQGSDAHIDLVELTGDMFMLATPYNVEAFIEYMEIKASQYGFMYASIWGNHDRHGIYNPNWLGAKFASAKHSIYFEPDDDLYGRSNFVINLTNEDEVKWQIANLDSGASFSETAVSPFRDYDYIREDQVDWWVKEHDLAGKQVPTIAYYHIPQDENLKAWESRASRKHKFFKLERFADNGNERYASSFIETGKENNLKAAFMGHAHNVDWTVDYDGVVIGLGVKTGTELYFAHIDVNNDDPILQEGLSSVGISENFDLIGASLVSLHDDDSFDLEHLYFNEREGGDFVAWRSW